MTKYAARTFKNGAHITGFLTTDQKLSEEAAIRMAKSWKERFSGVDNAGKTPVLEEGLKFQPLSMTPEDAMFIESARLGVEEVARIFGVPLHMLGNLERATFSNIEHQSREFVMYSLRPWVKRWEEEINRKLFTESEKRRGFYYRFNLDSLLRGDSEARSKLIDTYMKWGILNRDEVRKLEGFNNSDDGTGSTHYVPVNMVPAEMAGHQNESDETEPTIPE
jgi:HK97 family phage portal protein